MGVYHYLDHRFRDESFELNKGDWEPLAKSSAWLDRETLLTAVLECLSKNGDKDVDVKWAFWVRDELWKWNHIDEPRMYKQPTLNNDANTDYVPKKITGTVYPERYEDGSLTAWYRKHYGSTL